MLVAVYVRMSTDRQESSIERQLDQVNKHIANKGYTVYKVYQDLALKGYDWERPAFQELMADAKKSLFHGIVVDEEWSSPRKADSELRVIGVVTLRN